MRKYDFVICPSSLVLSTLFCSASSAVKKNFLLPQRCGFAASMKEVLSSGWCKDWLAPCGAFPFLEPSISGTRAPKLICERANGTCTLNHLCGIASRTDVAMKEDFKKRPIQPSAGRP